MDDRRHFRIERESHGERIAILVAHGDLDIYAAPVFKEALLETIDAGWATVVVDITGAPFIDSTGLGVLVSGAKKARRGSFVVVCDDEGTLQIFDIVGFERLFTVYRSRAEALAALALRDAGQDQPVAW